MVRFPLIICGIFTLLIFQNGYPPVNGCLMCNIESISKFVNSSISKMHANSLKKKKVITLSITNSVTVKTKLEIPKGCEFPESIHTAGDLVALFNSMDALNGLTEAGKKTAVEMLISYFSSLTVPLQPNVLLNLVTVLSTSPTLLEELSEPYVKSALMTITVDQRILFGVPKKELTQLFRKLLSMPPHRLVYCVPESAFVVIVGAMSSPDPFNGIPVDHAINLITAISLSSGSWFRCLPPSFLISLLQYLAVRPVMQKLPPSTLFGFLEGLFEALNDSSHFLADTVPAITLSAVVSPLIAPWMLSVFPIRIFDLLLSVLGSSPALMQTLPASKLVTLFTVLTTSPRLLSSLNPIHFGNVLVTVSSSKTLASVIPSSTWENLLGSTFYYLPECFAYINCNTK